MTNFITDDLIKANSKLKVSLSSASSTLTEAVTPVPFDTTDYNVGQGFSYSAGSITCLFDGYVTVQAAAVGTGAWSGTGFALCVYKDGSQAAIGQNGTQSRMTVATTLQVSKNEVLQIRLVGGSAAVDGPIAATYATFSRVAEYSAGSAAGFGLASETQAGLLPFYGELTVSNLSVSSICAVPFDAYYTRIGRRVFVDLISSGASFGTNGAVLGGNVDVNYTDLDMPTWAYPSISVESTAMPMQGKSSSNTPSQDGQFDFCFSARLNASTSQIQFFGGLGSLGGTISWAVGSSPKLSFSYTV